MCRAAEQKDTDKIMLLRRKYSGLLVKEYGLDVNKHPSDVDECSISFLTAVTSYKNRYEAHMNEGMRRLAEVKKRLDGEPE